MIQIIVNAGRDSITSGVMLTVDLSCERQVDLPLMLPRIHQHPHLSSRLAVQNARKRTGAARANIVFFGSRVLELAHGGQRQVGMWLDSRRLPMKLRAGHARLNCEFHLWGYRLSGNVLRK
ncbi:hypothetical protein [Paraburkholderia sp.]|jgi:hypothetical protein|uniref:hypothetical protein n=1 Tax=Paraburkholderia sp. TaxID=1926495 RepID=UPI002F40C69A